MWWVLAVVLVFQERLKFVQPADEAFAGETKFEWVTDLPQEEMIGLEFFINGESVHYFENPPFETTVDLSFFAQGTISFRAVLQLFDGREFTAEKEGENFSAFVREDVQLVRVPVQVTGGSRDYQLGDFAILEEGKPQKASMLFNQEKPMQLVVLLDLSGSMEKRVVMLRQGVRALIDSLKPEDSIQIIGFNHYVFEISPPDTDKEAVKKKLSTLRADGCTNLFGAIWSGVKTVAQTNQRRAIVLFTDGQHEVQYMEDPYEKTLGDCITIAKEKGVPIYAMGLGFGVSPETLESLAEATGGKAFLLRGGKSIRRAFETIGEELRRQYLLCYYSPTRKKGWHHIQVKLRKEPEVVLRFPKKLYFN